MLCSIWSWPSFMGQCRVSGRRIPHWTTRWSRNKPFVKMSLTKHQYYRESWRYILRGPWVVALRICATLFAWLNSYTKFIITYLRKLRTSCYFIVRLNLHHIHYFLHLMNELLISANLGLNLVRYARGVLLLDRKVLGPLTIVFISSLI